MEKTDIDQLIKSALSVRQNAYAPYSNYRVGAAILTTNGKVFVGCNVENVSYPAGSCAERNAIAAAVAEGYTDFVAIAVAGNTRDGTMPCGICRQVLAEFHVPFVIVVTENQGYRLYSTEKLLPYQFTDTAVKKADTSKEL